jgi:hypothetical protein
MEAKLRIPSYPRGVYEVGNVILIEKADGGKLCHQPFLYKAISEYDSYEIGKKDIDLIPQDALVVIVRLDCDEVFHRVCQSYLVDGYNCSTFSFPKD